MSEVGANDPEVQAYLEDIQQEANTSTPEQLRKSVIFKAKQTEAGRRVFGWMKDKDGNDYNYQAVRYGQQYLRKEGPPVAGTREKIGTISGGWANPTADSRSKMQKRSE